MHLRPSVFIKISISLVVNQPELLYSIFRAQEPPTGECRLCHVVANQLAPAAKDRFPPTAAKRLLDRYVVNGRRADRRDRSGKPRSILPSLPLPIFIN